MGKRIDNRSFFARPAEDVAKDLLGKILCRKSESGDCYSWRIIETEAYPEGVSNRTDDIYKSVGMLVNDRGTGLEVTCKDTMGCDNVLIRGVVAIFDSHPYKLKCAFGCGLDKYAFSDRTTNILNADSDIFVFDDDLQIDENDINKSQNQPKKFKLNLNNVTAAQMLGQLDIPFSKRQ